MWAEFEWENKITVNTNLTDLNDYLEHLLTSTNMNCLTPKQALTGGCGFLAANLYARSIFGEDALANVSIEKPISGGAESPVQGHVRIRAKTQVGSLIAHKIYCTCTCIYSSLDVLINTCCSCTIVLVVYTIVLYFMIQS